MLSLSIQSHLRQRVGRLSSRETAAAASYACFPTTTTRHRAAFHTTWNNNNNHTATTSWLHTHTLNATATKNSIAAMGQLQLQQHLQQHSIPSIHNPFFQQVRWKRKDGNRFHMQGRPPTKKQRKRHNRKLRDLQKEKDKHGKPGSKAGPRREWAESLYQDMVNPVQPATQEELEKYTFDDALLDDLIGNTSAATPTPEPVYLGHKYQKFQQLVSGKLKAYTRKMELLQAGDSSNKELVALEHATLPTDEEVSLAIRSYRDKFGTRRQPVGTAKALQYVLKELQVPASCFGEFTYTSLMTCAATPAEGRRILLLQRQQLHPVSAYSWSILVDVYAKTGDYLGAVGVHREMLAAGVTPTLASFTSILAACHKVCADGRISHALRDKAARVAWEQWQEMRVVGITPDVMAYGAMLRIQGVRGKPEAAINILEEMQLTGVAPTTLCFTAALRAVAKSHATALRYEHGFTRRNMRREFIAAHHGKLAHSIVLMAEQAEVEQDKGFIAALINCAATAGDLATAKAIYVANQIRRLDQFRTIGSDEHLARLRGESGEEKEEDEMLQLAAGDDEGSQGRRRRRKKGEETEFGLREYGKDSRVLSAIMQACAAAAGSNMVGTMWQGRENEGFLHLNSLRLLTARKIPQYDDRDIPGATSLDAVKTLDEEREEGYREGKRPKSIGRKKDQVLQIDENAAANLDELSETFSSYYEDKDGQLKPEYRKRTLNDIWKTRYGRKSGINMRDDHERYDRRLDMTAEEIQALENEDFESLAELEAAQEKKMEEMKALEAAEKPKEAPMHFNLDTMRWEPGPAPESPSVQQVKAAASKTITTLETPNVSASTSQSTETVSQSEEELYFDADAGKWKTRPKTQSVEVIQKSEKVKVEPKSNASPKVEEELYFDPDSMKWQTRPKIHSAQVIDGSESFTAKQSSNLRRDKEEKPQELYFDANESKWKAKDEKESFVRTDTQRAALAEARRTITQELDFESFFADLKKDIAKEGINPGDITEADARELFESIQDDDELAKLLEEGYDEGDYDDELQNVLSSSTSTPHAANGAKPSPTSQSTATAQLDNGAPESPEETQEPGTSEDFDSIFDDALKSTEESVRKLDEDLDPDLEELRAYLPAFSDRRLLQVHRAFAKNLGDPSLLDLIRVSRETMPDFVTNTWLKQMSILTARFVMQHAIDEGLLDIHMLNGVLQLETSIGRLSSALEFHQTAYKKNGLKPSEYSDRLVLQMFLDNKRFGQAMKFKQTVEQDGRLLDLQSYGSLIDFCAKRGQVGSAMLLLHECRQRHGGSQPGNAHLAQLRIKYRQARDLREPDLEELIGPDPIRWLKHGERHLKREMSKKGRHVQELVNLPTRL